MTEAGLEPARVFSLNKGTQQFPKLPRLPIPPLGRLVPQDGAKV